MREHLINTLSNHRLTGKQSHSIRHGAPLSPGHTHDSPDLPGPHALRSHDPKRFAAGMDQPELPEQEEPEKQKAPQKTP